MEDQRPHDLNHASPTPGAPGWVAAAIVPRLGIAVTMIGLVVWLFAFIGVDNSRQIIVGLLVAAFGITWWILGIILQIITSRK